MAKLVAFLFVVCLAMLWYFLLTVFGVKDRSGNDLKYESNDRKNGGWFGSSVFVSATNGHGSPLEGRDIHHHERGGHIKRDFNHCWRRYDGYNMQNTVIDKKQQLKKPYGILCKFKCTWFFLISFPTCEFIYDYKLSCYLFTSLPDCTSIKCTLLDYFS